jgi:hypothetical protein
MTEQRTPDELSPQQQTELICKKLLGLRVHHLPYASVPCTTWSDDKYNLYNYIDKFETWPEAGLILEALKKAWPASRDQLRNLGGALVIGDFRPSDVRAAALEYIRSLP